MNRLVLLSPSQLVYPTYVSNGWNMIRKRYLAHTIVLYKLDDIYVRVIVK